MKHFSVGLFIVLALLSTGQSLAQQCGVSVLGDINCGAFRATCSVVLTGLVGVVSCNCTPTCLAPGSLVGTVQAERGFSWGQNSPCLGLVTGKAWGESAGYVNLSVMSGLHAQDQASGAVIGGILGSSYQDDCSMGLSRTIWKSQGCAGKRSPSSPSERAADLKRSFQSA